MPNKGLPRTRPPEIRFQEKVEIVGDCVLWMGAASSGYGNFWTGESTVRAHVWHYEQTVGPVPEGMVLDHYLDCSTLCIQHVRPATQRENLLRGDTVTSRNAAKTHCPQGHSLDDAYDYPTGRQCRPCSNERDRAAYRRRKMETAA